MASSITTKKGITTGLFSASYSSFFYGGNIQESVAEKETVVTKNDGFVNRFLSVALG